MTADKSYCGAKSLDYVTNASSYSTVPKLPSLNNADALRIRLAVYPTKFNRWARVLGKFDYEKGEKSLGATSIQLRPSIGALSTAEHNTPIFSI